MWSRRRLRLGLLRLIRFVRHGGGGWTVGRGFLTPEELERFSKEYAMFPRTVVTERGQRAPAHDEVGDAVRKLVQGVRLDGRSFRCGVVAVHEGDGMSWAATAAERALSEERPDVDRVRLSGVGATTHLPAIGVWTGDRVLAKLARRHGLTDELRVLSPWVSAAVILAVLAGLFHAWVSTGLAFGSLADPLVIVLVGLGGVVQLAREIVVKRATGGAPSPARKLARAFADGATSQPEAHARVVRALARHLARVSPPRCVVVDDFGRLDPTTSAVLRHYIAHEAGNGCSEAWIVFENADEKALWNESIGPGARRLRRYELTLLDDHARRRLATYDGTDRFDYVTVRGVRSGFGVERGKDVDLFLSDYRRDTPSPETGFGELELFYLLSLTAAWGRAPTLSVQELEGKLRQGNIRNQLLVEFLGSEPTLQLLRMRMSAMVERLGRFVDVTIPEAGFERELVFHRADIGREIAEVAQRRGLPAPALGHLFWALYWHDQLRHRSPEPFWTHRLAIHLAEGLPSVHEHSPSTEVVESLFEAAFDTVRWCIHTSVLEPVRRLLESALTLVGLEDPGAAKRTRRLLRLAWEAYGVLGDERILATILTIESWETEEVRTGRSSRANVSSTASSAAVTVAGWTVPDEDRAHGPEDACERLFLQSLSVPQDRVASSWSRVLAVRDAEADALRAYGRVRGAWLAVTLTRLGCWRGLPGDELLPAARERATHALSDCITDACDRLTAGDEGRLATIDYLSVSMGLWAAAVLVADASKDHIEESLTDFMPYLEAVAETVHLLYEYAVESTTRGSSDFVVHVLTRELLVGVAASATLMAPRAEGPMAVRLDGIAEAAINTLAGPRDPVAAGVTDWAGEVRRQLDLQAVAWERLGVSELRACADLRAAQHDSVLAPDGGLKTFSRIADELEPERRERGHVGMMAGAIIASGAEWSNDMSAQVINSMLAVAIGSDLGDELTTELCLIDLCAGHAAAIDLEMPLEYLTKARRVGTRTPLEEWLSRVPDGRLDRVALIVLNAVRESDRADLKSMVFVALEERAASAEDPDAVRGALDHLESSRIHELIKAGGAIDAEQTIGAWRDRRDASCYPWLLYVLADKVPRELFVEEASTVLRNTEAPGLGTACILLAVSVLDSRRAGEDERDARDEAIAFLESSVVPWEGSLTTESNIDAYQMLRNHSAKRPRFHKERLLYWDLVKHKRDAWETIPSLCDDGRFFTVFSHHCVALLRWGLPMDDADVFVHPGKPGDVVRAWRDEGSAVPEPFLDGEALSGPFLAIGEALLAVPGADPDLDDARARFDEVARQSMDPLYALIDGLRSVPEEIRMIFRRHRERFAQYTALR